MWGGKRRHREDEGRRDKQLSVSQIHVYIGIYIYIHQIEIENGMSFAFYGACWGKVLTVASTKLKKKRKEFPRFLMVLSLRELQVSQ